MGIIAAYLLFLAGFAMLLSVFLPSPRGRSIRAIRDYGRKRDARPKITALLEIPAAKLAGLLAPRLRLHDVRLTNMLRDADDPRTPEEFIAAVLALCVSLLLPGLLFLAFSLRPIAAVFAALAVYYAFTSFRDLVRAGKIKSKAIDLELPRFAVYVKQSLKTNHNALLLLERYTTENEVFSDALSRTIADIKTSNFESALLRFNNCYNSERLSMIVRGLIGIYNGDDVAYYFELLEKDFTESEINRLRREIKKIPASMRRSMIVVYAAIALLFFTPIMILILDNLHLFFS